VLHESTGVHEWRSFQVQFRSGHCARRAFDSLLETQLFRNAGARFARAIPTGIGSCAPSLEPLSLIGKSACTRSCSSRPAARPRASDEFELLQYFESVLDAES